MLALSLLTLLACTDKDPVTDDTGTSVADAPTWSDDVSPIFARSCMGCHADGSIGPMKLDNYADAATWAAPAAAAIAERSMPPFLVTGDGSCGDYANNQWLSDEEIAIVAAWADAGAPEGTAGTTAEPEPLATLETVSASLSTPDFVPEIAGGEYAEFDEYRCFDLGTIEEDTFLTGYDVVPGNAPMVHHVLVMPVDMTAAASGGRTAEEQIATLAAQDEREGWPCFSGAGNGVPDQGTVVAWAPGQGAVNYPAGTGVKLDAGVHMIAQVHFNLFDETIRGQSDQSAVQLQLESDVEREGFIALPDGFLETLGGWNEAAIPFGEDAWSYTWDMQSLDLLYYYSGDYDGIIGAEIAGVLPHMHQYGEQMSVSLDGECLAQVDNWDFEWQRMYFYEEGVSITGEETLEVTCTWDTQSVEQDITPGWGTYNEMCLPGLYVVIERQ